MPTHSARSHRGPATVAAGDVFSPTVLRPLFGIFCRSSGLWVALFVHKYLLPVLCLQGEPGSFEYLVVVGREFIEFAFFGGDPVRQLLDRRIRRPELALF